MRWIPKSRKVRWVAGSVVGLLAVGAVVGSSAFDASDGSGRGSHTASRLPESHGGGAPSADFMTSAAGGGGNFAVPHSGSGTADAVVSGGGMTAAPVSGQSLPPIDAGRVVKTATLDLRVGKGGLDAAHDKALAAVEESGGFVQNSDLSPTRATLTLRVPADRFERTLATLRDLGEVRDEGVSGQDVSEEYVDLEARLRHWTSQEAVFLELLGKAGSVAETVEVRRELSMIQQTIEQLQGRIRYLDDRTGFSTVTLSMAVAGASSPGGTDGPSLSEAWDQAWDAGLSVIGGTIIALGALLPLAAIAGAVALVLTPIVRRRRAAAAPAPAA